MRLMPMCATLTFMEQATQFDSVRGAILRKQEEIKRQQQKLQDDLALIDRLAVEYGVALDSVEAPRPVKAQPKLVLPSDAEILNAKPNTLVQATMTAMDNRPSERLWTSRKLFQAVKEDGFVFTRAEEFGPSSVSVVMKKLVRDGRMQIVRPKAGKVAAVYQVVNGKDIFS